MPEGGSAEVEKVLVQVRLPKDLVKQIDHLCVDWELYRAELIEQILREGVKTYNGPEASRS